MQTTSPVADDRGFTLVEAVVAASLLCFGLLALAQVFYLGMQHMSTSSAQLIAREKARESIESVHAARDTGTTKWMDIRNVDAPTGCPAGTTATGGGKFLSGLRALVGTGPDGLANTADDTGTEVAPGPDHKFNTADDVGLTGAFRREVEICDVNGNPSLRLITVRVEYRVGKLTRTYVLTSYVSSYA